MKIIEIDKMQFVELYLDKLFSNRYLYVKRSSGRDLLNVFDYSFDLTILESAKLFVEESVLLEYEKRKLSVEDN